MNDRSATRLFELLAEGVDVYVDHVGEGVLRLFPYVSPQHGPRHGRVLVPKEVLEHLELSKRERNLRVVLDDAATEKIHLKPGAVEHSLAFSLTAPKDHP